MSLAAKKEIQCPTFIYEKVSKKKEEKLQVNKKAAFFKE